MQSESSSNPRCPVISFSEEEILSFYKPWSKALVVKVLEKAFSFLVIKRRLESLWARSGRIQVSDMANNFFLIRFSKEKDYQRALFEGPCRVAVERIGNHIGRTVRLDLATAEGARARYARVCVEVDLSRPLLGKYVIEDKVFLVEYESLDNICFSCGLYGHREDDCRPAEANVEVVPPANEVGTGESSGAVANSRSWMIVKRRQHKPIKAIEPSSKPTQYQGSRFGILGDEMVQDEPNVHETEQSVSQSNIGSSDPSQLAEALKAVLDKALKTKSGSSKAASKVKAPKDAKAPLSDVSNLPNKKKVNTTKKVDKPVDFTDGLVTVPVMFENSVFQSTGAKQKTKSKAKSAGPSQPPSSKTNSSNKVKRFGPKLPDPIGAPSEKQPGIGEPRKDVSLAGGRPPDSV
ncbi:hypothetical protein LINPERHAP1_LOCUS36599 [Linum perenne]